MLEYPYFTHRIKIASLCLFVVYDTMLSVANTRIFNE
jgi:hypothetical protein